MQYLGDVMGYTYRLLKREFSFLHDIYGLVICRYQKSGAYYYIAWENKNVEITVVYDEREHNPLKILVHDKKSSKTILDATEFVDEISCDCEKERGKIEYAAKWLKEAISMKQIKVHD